MVTASTIHMALMGGEGLANTAGACHANTQKLVGMLTALEGVDKQFDSPVFHEQVLALDAPVAEVLHDLSEHNVLGGYPLADEYPELGNCLLVCATEKRSEDQMQKFADTLDRVLSTHRRAS
jgi:glycine dehydrogenase subunit 1